MKSKDFHSFYDDFLTKFIALAYKDSILPYKKNDFGDDIQMTRADEEIWFARDDHDEQIIFGIVGRSVKSASHLWKKSEMISKNKPEENCIVHSVIFNNAMKFLGFEFPKGANFEDHSWCDKALFWFLEKKKEEKRDDIFILGSDPLSNLFRTGQIYYEVMEYWYCIESQKFDDAFNVLRPNLYSEMEGGADLAKLYSKPINRTKLHAFHFNRYVTNEVDCYIYYETTDGFQELLVAQYMEDEFQKYVIELKIELEKCARSFRIKSFKRTPEDLLDASSIEDFWFRQSDSAETERDRYAFIDLATAKNNNINAYVVLHCRYIFIENKLLLSEIKTLSMSFHSQRT